MVRVRKDEHKKFKGSCFIEYANEESVKTAVEAGIFLALPLPSVFDRLVTTSC